MIALNIITLPHTSKISGKLGMKCINTGSRVRSTLLRAGYSVKLKNNNMKV